MRTEFEITFPNIKKQEIRKKIKSLWGICTKEKTLMRRTIFEWPLDPVWTYVRVRDEGDKVTCTYKNVAKWKLDVNSVKEIETEVKDFDAMKGILENIGLKTKAYQETYREVWQINDEVEFMIDVWPGLNPYIEIEGASEEIIKKYAKLLGFDYEKWFFGTVDQIYQLELGIAPEIINNLELITFENPPQA